jgi:cytoskeletal protein RodZ
MDLRKKTLSNKNEEGSAPEGELTSKRKKPTGKFQKVIIGCVMTVVVGVLVVAVVMYSREGGKSVASKEEVTTKTETQEGTVASTTGETDASTAPAASSDTPWLNATPDGGSTTTAESTEPKEPAVKLTKPDSKVTPGITDPSKDRYIKNYSNLEKDTYTKDLNGNKVPEHYDVENISTVIDFISYKKKRATTDAGIELYWLDATYKGRKAKVQVPFRIFKELDPVGVTVVDVEVTKIPNADPSKDPYEIITGFTVRDDYKKVLEEAKMNDTNNN